MTVLYNKSKNLPKRLELRKNQTPEENIVWEKVRRNQLGFKCKRQFSVGPYVLDFYFPTKKLAIEIDGAQHISNKEYDIERSNYLSVLGIRVIRFWNKEIQTNISLVIEKITKDF